MYAYSRFIIHYGSVKIYYPAEKYLVASRYILPGKFVWIRFMLLTVISHQEAVLFASFIRLATTTGRLLGHK